MILFLLAVLLIVIMWPEQDNAQQPQPNKEGFVLSAQPVTVSPITGALIGQGILTDQMTRMSTDKLIKQVNSNGFVTDGAMSIGVGVGNGFDQLYNNQLDIQAIDARAEGGYQQRSDLSEISQKIASSSNNANNNLFTRAGSTPTKLYLAPNEIRCVIDEKYLPERDKNRRVASVGTVIPMQGYDLNIERIGEELTDTHFSNLHSNKKRTRIPTAAGATAANGSESPVGNVAAEQVEVNGNNIKIKDSVARDADVTVPME